MAGIDGGEWLGRFFLERQCLAVRVGVAAYSHGVFQDMNIPNLQEIKSVPTTQLNRRI
jgi:hypothetical protein